MEDDAREFILLTQPMLSLYAGPRVWLGLVPALIAALVQPRNPLVRGCMTLNPVHGGSVDRAQE